MAAFRVFRVFRGQPGESRNFSLRFGGWLVFVLGTNENHVLQVFCDCPCPEGARASHPCAVAAGPARNRADHLRAAALRGPMRTLCYRCFWPKPLCWCPSLVPMATRTRFLFLMSPKEFKVEKAGTGRLTHLCLPNSELHMHMEMSFDKHEQVQAVLNDPQNFCVLLYPGKMATNLSVAEQVPAFTEQIAGRRLVVILIDATWGGARKIHRLSPSLQRLPRIMFTPSTPSRYVIKQQPKAGCLSTLEAVHELLLVLEKAGLDAYPLPEQLLGIFQRMQDFQIKCAADPNRPGYRRNPYSDPAQRNRIRGERAGSRDNFLPQPTTPPVT